jgi:hypothetical protein
MGKHEIELSDAAESRLALVVAQYNVATGAQLTLTQWLSLHLKELAIQREMAGVGEQLRQQAEADANAALAAERARLLAEM